MEELQYSPTGKLRYRIGADALMALHTFWVLGIMVCGTLYILVLQSAWYLPWHAMFVTGTFLLDKLFSGCIFTRWEHKLRLKYDPETDFDEESFIDTYLRRWFGITLGANALTHALNIIFIITWARIAYVYI